MSNSSILIREYEPADLDALIDVFRAAIMQTASANYSEAQRTAWAQVDTAAWSERRLSRPTWLAEVNGSVAGFTDLEPNGHLDMMYVHPRFARFGVATALLDTAEHHARKLGLARIYSEVSLTARPFFERHGFRVVEPERVHRNGQWFDRFRMEKALVTTQPGG